VTTTRRAFLATLTAGLLTTPVPVGAQASTRVPRIAWLGGQARETAHPYVSAFQRGLNELGWVEGQNLRIEWRFSGGLADRLPGFAAELVRLGVDLILVPSAPTALAARDATKTIPLVTVAVAEPVELGLVQSLARPGGNITGLTSSVGPEISGKQLELLKGLVPKVARMALLWNPTTPGNETRLRQAEMAARSLKVEPQTLEVRSGDDYDRAFAAMTTGRAGALLVVGDVMFATHRSRLTALAAKSRLPAIYSGREYVEVGGLMSYGPSTPDLFRRAATYVDKVLRGAKPADLPMEQPTKFELLINAKAARNLGLAIPQSLRERVDQVIG
jgi:putative tryptophan/tyrosine transport system substrate-binding protein